MVRGFADRWPREKPLFGGQKAPLKSRILKNDLSNERRPRRPHIRLTSAPSAFMGLRLRGSDNKMRLLK